VKPDLAKLVPSNTLSFKSSRNLAGCVNEVPAKKLFLLDLGRLGGDIGWFLPGAAGGAATRSNRDPKRRWLDFPVTAAVIEHDDGVVLFDAGFDPDGMRTHPNQTEMFPIAQFSRDNMLDKQLSLIKLKPDDITLIVLSHLHWDHVGHLNLLDTKHTPLIVQKRELQWALHTLWTTQGPTPYAIEDMKPLIRASWVPIDDQVFDLLDGVTLNWTGGHTPGHQVMRAKLRSGGDYLLSGDYLHIPEEYDLEAKGWLLGNADEWTTYMRKLKLTVLAQKAKVVIGHDPNLWSKYSKAPKSLR